MAIVVQEGVEEKKEKKKVGKGTWRNMKGRKKVEDAEEYEGRRRRKSRWGVL